MRVYNRRLRVEVNDEYVAAYTPKYESGLSGKDVMQLTANVFGSIVVLDDRLTDDQVGLKIQRIREARAANLDIDLREQP